MTTMRDYLKDIVRDVQLDLINLNEDKDIATLSDADLEDKVDEYLDMIRDRLIG